MTILSVVNSTNQYLLDYMYKLQSGDACVAEYQQTGRGRRGRKWISPFGANLYLSIYWNFAQELTAAVGLGLVIGVVVAEVLQRLGAKDVRVKWPNDLYLNDRKLAGILVEMIKKTDALTHIVIGVGINLTMHNNHASAINQKWANLKDAGISIDRNELTATLLNELRKSLKQLETNGLSSFIARWHLLDNFINRPVQLLIGAQYIFGIARGIDRQGALLLDQHGVISSFINGEISMRNRK